MSESKICVSCSIEKYVGCFSANKFSSDFKRSECKNCSQKLYDEGYKTCCYCLTTLAIEHFYKNNRNTGKLSDHDSRCKKCTSINLDKKKKAEYDKKYLSLNREILKLKNQSYARNNKEKINAYKREYRKKRLKEDIQFHLHTKVRGRIYGALKARYSKTIKSDKTIKLLGCSYAEYKIHIESLFTVGMTWEKVFNGEIEIDHIKPVCSFDLRDTEQQRICFNYTNTQPLWAEDNVKKCNEDRKLSIRKQLKQSSIPL